MSEQDQPTVERIRPRFRQPTGIRADPLDPTLASLTPPPADGEQEDPGRAPADQPDPETPKPAATAATTSSTGTVGRGGRRPFARRAGAGEQTELAERIAKALVGVLAAGAAAARILLRRRGIEIRDMTSPERDDIAEPLARIGSRHLSLDLGPILLQ